MARECPSRSPPKSSEAPQGGAELRHGTRQEDPSAATAAIRIDSQAPAALARSQPAFWTRLRNASGAAAPRRPASFPMVCSE